MQIALKLVILPPNFHGSLDELIAGARTDIPIKRASADQ